MLADVEAAAMDRVAALVLTGCAQPAEVIAIDGVLGELEMHQQLPAGSMDLLPILERAAVVFALNRCLQVPSDIDGVRRTSQEAHAQKKPAVTRAFRGFGTSSDPDLVATGGFEPPT